MGELIGTVVPGVLYYAGKDELDRLRGLNAPIADRVRVFADAARLNTLYMIARAGSGHIGSSFSSLDIVSLLHLDRMKGDDIYYSSKGHDAPGLYAVLIALGMLPFDKINGLRRLGGLPGHPDVGTPGMVVNSGSLGMGISKAKGMVRADRHVGRKRQIYVMTGDGELQEGQIWESLGSAANAPLGEITVIVDHNKLQSDYLVSQTSDLGDLDRKFAAFGWAVERCDGHDIAAVTAALDRLSKSDLPKVLIADTVKGRGVSFMEHTAMESDAALYRFHSGAPDADSYRRAAQEILDRINQGLAGLGAGALAVETFQQQAATAAAATQRLVPAYTEAIIAAAAARPNLFALDADLLLDTGLIPFREKYPERFIECGIAEMDMASQAGGLALQGMLPICHSFGCFLTTRPNEQIYNNATERTKVLYVGTLAGLIPAAPGHSHQSLRDISALGAIPDFDIVEPCCPDEVGRLLEYLLDAPGRSGYLRLISVPWQVPYTAPSALPAFGQGTVIRDGTDVALVTYGMIMTAEAFAAAEQLASHGISAKVITTPFLNRADGAWYAGTIGDARLVCTIDNHYADGGFGDVLGAALFRAGARPARALRLGVETIPASGQPREVLAHHGLDADSIARSVREALGR